MVYKQPFDFYEISVETGDYNLMGQLWYENETDRAEKSTQFWKEALGITRIG